MKAIITGGGTGGHVFPALAIANALRSQDKNIEILFVGAEGKLEMDKVPKAGYEIVGLPIRGFIRKLTISNIIENFKTLFRLFKSLRIARRVIRDFKPNVVVGVGGYASGPVMRIAGQMGIPIAIQEQNSFAGLTNKLVAKYVSVVCVAFDGMEKFFPNAKIVKTGNPVREIIWNNSISKEEAKKRFGFDAGKPLVLVMGGSGGALSMNEAMRTGEALLKEYPDVQWFWQTGKYYYEKYSACPSAQLQQVKASAFIDGMEYAYAAADVVIGRAGALTIAEVCLLKKPVVLVPSPNVAENHQMHNAMALVNKEAAVLVEDNKAKDEMVKKAIEIIQNPTLKATLENNIETFGKRDAAQHIASEILKIIQ